MRMTHILGCPQNRKNIAVEVFWNAHLEIWDNDYTDGEWIVAHWMHLPTPPKGLDA